MQYFWRLDVERRNPILLDEKKEFFLNAWWKSNEASSHSYFKYILYYGSFHAFSFVAICDILAFHISKYSNVSNALSSCFQLFCTFPIKMHGILCHHVQFAIYEMKTMNKMNRPHFSDFSIWEWLIFAVRLSALIQLSVYPIYILASIKKLLFLSSWRGTTNNMCVQCRKLVFFFFNSHWVIRDNGQGTLYWI